MRSFTLLSVVLVAVLVVLQWGGESNAMPSPVPVAPYYQPQAQPYYSYATPSYTYTQPQTSKVAQPTYSPSKLPSEYEGLYDKNAVVGSENIQFTGFDVLGNVNLPANVLSITDVLDSLGGLGL